ncbi:cytochrome ubiquinol oxidase subunit I [Carboxydothermus ferrireducens]|uniref:Cytochrome d ubiquinol oxidase subunit I n=2 Tax=Carboxydothermus TaxID=129957 RepID=A0ABX2R9H7_9THEO|nr:cytochrome ubiquinol oxidase subunit I [Carboxydothermus ferrireducens]NYE57826.1 cytochrome d ubiquinol oxidase subunit I [Carboxydothermus ferrireducens DSM 11255]
MMDLTALSRLQFTVTAIFHFFYVPLTLGLAVLIAYMEYKYWRTNDEVWDKMARFWTKLFAINFAVGVASGITMEFQFGTNWADYSRFVGDIFGAPLAAEGVFAFFLESTFIGLLLFGRDKISRGMRFLSAVLVAFGTNLSAFWIIAANSWQQTPAGYKLEGGRAILTSFKEAVFSPSTLPRFLHTLDGAYVTAAFFVMGISAYYLLRKKNVEIARPSLRVGIIFGLIFALLQIYFGDIHAKQVAVTQPAKLAAFEGLWETQEKAPLLILGWPDTKNEKNVFEIGVPGLLSYLAHGDVNQPVKGIKEFPREERPPILPTFLSFHLMVGLGILMALALLWAVVELIRGKIYNNRLLLKLLLYFIPLPYIANELGWITAEVGRQPWIVYGLLKTSDAVSKLDPGQLVLTNLLFIAVYLFLGGLMLYLMVRTVKTHNENALGVAEREVA